MDTDRKTLQQVAVDDRNEFDDRSSLGTVLIVGGDEAWAISMGKILNDNLYGTSVASNGDQIIERLEGAWHHIILIDLDSIDVSEDYLARKIRKMEPDIPIIGLCNYATGPCLDITYLKKPLSLELIKKYFPRVVSKKETKGGRKALNGLVLAGSLALLLWLFLFWIWK